MTYAFAKDSRACAVCQSWAGQRELSPDMTLAYVPRYSAEGECRTAVSQDYGRVTKSYHTCECWSAMLMLRAHGARHSRTPGPSAAMEGLLAATPGDKRAAPPPPAPPSPSVSAAPARAAAPPLAPIPPVELCDSTPLDFDKVPPTALVLLNYWRRLKGDRALPAAAEINTAALRDTLTKLSLFAPAADGQGFEYRACGRAVRRRLEIRPAGRRVEECHDPDSAARLNADLRACLADSAARAVLVRGDKLLPGQKFVELFLPLSDPRGAPAFVLAWRNVPGG